MQHRGALGDAKQTGHMPETEQPPARLHLPSLQIWQLLTSAPQTTLTLRALKPFRFKCLAKSCKDASSTCAEGRWVSITASCRSTLVAWSLALSRTARLARGGCSVAHASTRQLAIFTKCHSLTITSCVVYKIVAAQHLANGALHLPTWRSGNQRCSSQGQQLLDQRMVMSEPCTFSSMPLQWVRQQHNAPRAARRSAPACGSAPSAARAGAAARAPP